VKENWLAEVKAERTGSSEAVSTDIYRGVKGSKGTDESRANT
jgi:hypothetical protein